MLKHEEMIENVHRRIAQYEEEQKMKHSKNIKFFSAKPDIKTEENRTNEDGYIDVVSGTDIVRPANKVLRIVSTAAAAALLVTGIGATGFLMQRNKSNNKNKSENEVYLTEATDPNLVKPIGDNSVAPFADFNQLLFSLYIFNQDIKEYSDVTYNKLATFLNGFNWGEGAEIAESDIPDFDEYEGNGYGIFWKNGDLYFNVYITEDGKAYYIKSKCNPIGGAFEYPVIDSAVFNIDYDSFDKGVKDILKQNKPETGNSLSQMEIKRLSEGKFQEAELYYEMGIGSEQIIPEKAETKNALSKFLEKDFLTMLKKSGSGSDSANELMYMVVRCFKTSDTTVCRESFFIYTSGFVNLCSYDLTDKDEIPTGTWNYYIDTAEFETVLNDILSGKYDTKYPSEVKTTTTAVTTSVTTSATTAETTEADEQAPPHEEEPEEKEPTDEDIVRAFYLEMHNGHDGSINGTYEGYDENGNWVDYKNEINYMLHRAEIIPFDRELGQIIDEEDAIAKGREALLKIMGQEHIDYFDREYIEHPDGTKIYRDNPCYIANYYEDYDIWFFHPTLFQGSSEDGKYHVGTPGTVPYFYIRGCDGKILAFWY